MTAFSTTPIYDKQFGKLDKRMQGIVSKKMARVVSQPEPGKPMHRPLQNARSERIEKIRIIYRHENSHVTFLYFDHRDRVYG